jgi:hypothetical protein
VYAIGQVVHITGTIRDTAGTLYDPTDVVANITDAAGVTTTNAATKDSVGVYHYDYTPTVAGNFSWWFSATGTAQPADVFTVVPLSTGALISLADAKAQLNKTSTTDDDEIWRYIHAATDIINFECGYTAATPIVETVNMGRADYTTARFFTLTHTPVKSITTVTPQLAGAPPVSVANLIIDAESGVVFPAINTVQVFYGPLTVSYVAGRGVVPQALQTACGLIVQDMFKSQRGGGVLSLDQDPSDTSGPETYGIPERALQLMKMAPYSSGPSVA